MRGDEVRVVDAFCGSLEDHGWVAVRECADCDVATRSDRTANATLAGVCDHAVAVLHCQGLAEVAEPLAGAVFGPCVSSAFSCHLRMRSAYSLVTIRVSRRSA